MYLSISAVGYMRGMRTGVSVFNTISVVWAGILVQVTIHRRLLIGRDGRLDQLEAYDVS